MQENQMDLFGASAPRCEYYPVLLPDLPGLLAITSLNQHLENQGLKHSQLTKMPHISLDGITCPENDEQVFTDVRAFLSTQIPLLVEFTEVGYFPGRGGITLKLGIQNPEPILEFNKLFMTAIGGKITKLNLHLTLARYVDSGIFEKVKHPDIVYPKLCFSRSVAILKKVVGEKGAYRNIGVVEFGG